MFNSMASLMGKKYFRWSLAFLICIFMLMVVNAFQFAVVMFVESNNLVTESGDIRPNILIWVNIYITILLLAFLFVGSLLYYILYIVRDDNMSKNKVFFLKVLLFSVIIDAFFAIGFYFLFN